MTEAWAFDPDRQAPRRKMRSPFWVSALRRLIDRLQAGRLSVRLPSGEILQATGVLSGPEAAVDIHDWRALRRVVLRGDIGFAESYVAGEWSSRDLVALLRLAAINAPHMVSVATGGVVHRLFNRWRHRFRANSRGGSRRNIVSHYDLGNDFFRAWLGESMLYSSALWDDATADLEDAQRRKLQRIHDLLDVKRGQDILEIGCGWGALAAHLAKSGANRIVAVTLSPAQFAYARDRLSAQGHGGVVDMRLQDYRDAGGAFDHVVSIEMIEAVGEAYLPAYFGKIRQVLKRGGKAVIQAITIEEARFDDYRSCPDFIQRHIFPGGFLPTKTIIAEQAARAGLRLAHLECFGLSYARTLAEWRRRFESRWSDIAALGFDERFRRLWTYYLSYCEAGFRERATDVGFYVLERAETE